MRVLHRVQCARRHGNRANATMGRAVNLVKTSFYGSVPQDMDSTGPGTFNGDTKQEDAGVGTSSIADFSADA